MNPPYPRFDHHSEVSIPPSAPSHKAKTYEADADEAESGGLGNIGRRNESNRVIGVVAAGGRRIERRERKTCEGSGAKWVQNLP